MVALDLTDDDAPARVREILEREHGGRLHLLVNNAGAAWRGSFADTGWDNVERHMKLNLEAPVRLTEALCCRCSARPRSDNTDRPAACAVHRQRREHRGAGVAPERRRLLGSKFALAGWSDALHDEEAPHGVHVGLVLPGFVKTEGFPASELLANPATRWIVSTPEAVAEAIVEAGPGGKAERYVPRPYWLAAALRILAPRPGPPRDRGRWPHDRDLGDSRDDSSYAAASTDDSLSYARVTRSRSLE